MIKLGGNPKAHGRAGSMISFLKNKMAELTVNTQRKKYIYIYI
jgi:hypothetical protein